MGLVLLGSLDGCALLGQAPPRHLPASPTSDPAALAATGFQQRPPITRRAVRVTPGDVPRLLDSGVPLGTAHTFDPATIHEQVADLGGTHFVPIADSARPEATGPHRDRTAWANTPAAGCGLYQPGRPRCYPESDEETPRTWQIFRVERERWDGLPIGLRPGP